MTGPYSVSPWRSRREFLKSSVAMAASAYGLSSSFAMAAPVPEKFDGSAFKLKAPEPNAKSGGVLRHGIPLRAPHFDIHQAGTIFILWVTAHDTTAVTRAVRQLRAFLPQTGSSIAAEGAPHSRSQRGALLTARATAYLNAESTSPPNSSTVPTGSTERLTVNKTRRSPAACTTAI